MENAIDWKEAVDTYTDITEAYPDPQDGWTVNVKDTDYTYRYSGTEWVVISANAIPKATQSVDGLLAKEDKALYDDANSKKHTHSNKSTIDKITETLLARWSEAYDKRHDHENKGILDTITQTLLDHWNAAYTHVSNKSNPHGVTAAQVGAAATAHTHTKADITDFPTSLPANGGNAATVGGHTVNVDVPTGAKFTDTVYTHPSSGVPAGTYKSVTVNAQGHVTAGTNPTTLAGYGITDAAAKIHDHDNAYLKKTGLTWNDLKGV
jgi:phage-related tail fiber protein